MVLLVPLGGKQQQKHKQQLQEHRKEQQQLAPHHHQQLPEAARQVSTVCPAYSAGSCVLMIESRAVVGNEQCVQFSLTGYTVYVYTYTCIRIHTWI